MVWRQHYSTVIFRDLDCPATLVSRMDGSEPNHGRQVWIGGFGFDNLTDQSIWWKLFQSDFADQANIYRAFVFPSIGSSIAKDLQSLVPPSELKHCLLIEDLNNFWVNLTKDKRGFAAIIEGSNIQVLMVGPPTEDAWEEFSFQWNG